MANNNSNKAVGNGTKAFGGIIALVALIAGVYAMVEPMGQRIEFLQAEIHRLRQNIADHGTTFGHPKVLAETASIREKFVEVETQFRASREVAALKYDFNMERIEALEKSMAEKVSDRWTKADAEKAHEEIYDRMKELRKVKF